MTFQGPLLTVNVVCERPLIHSASSEEKEEKNSSTTAISTEKKSPFLNYDYEEVPFLPYESYEDYYSSVVAETTHGGEF